MTYDLSDIEADALCLVVQSGIAEIRAGLGGGAGDDPWLVFLRSRGRAELDSGTIRATVEEMSYPGRPGIELHLGAMAMLPGGVKVCGIVFCAAHYPAGTVERFRLSCPRCSPDDRALGERRDVVTIEGGL